jgi:outer membrane protein assembly factor BamB
MQHRNFRKGILHGAVVLVLCLMMAQTLTATNVQQKTVTTSDHTPATTDAWPMFHHDPAHSGYSYDRGPATNTVLWSFPTGAEVSGSPAFVDGRVYIGSWDKKLYCLDGTTGVKLWDYTTGLEIHSTPAVVDGKVYFGSNDGKLYCLDAETGAKLWDYQTGGEIASAPSVLDGRVIFGSRDRTVYCLDSSTGVKLWNYTTGGDIISSPAVKDGRVLIGSWDDKVYCLDEDTGVKLWDFTTGNDVYSSPSVADSIVCVGSSDYKLYGLEEDTGNKIWEYTTGASIESSPAQVGDRVYVGSFDHKIYCINEGNGEKIWEHTVGDYVYSSPAIDTDGRLYVTAFDNKIYCLDAGNGSLLWSYPTGYMNWASPAVAEGRMIVASGNHQVYCFKDPNDPPLTPPAPDGPDTGVIGVSYIFTVATTDPQGDSIMYQFSWGDGTFSDWLGPYPSGNTASASHAWTTAGTYNITVKAKDASEESDWSPAHTILIHAGPILEIQAIKGGLFSAKTSIKNIGSAEATNVTWTITIAGKTTNGTISSIPVNEEHAIKSGLVIGFGKTTIHVTAASTDSSDSKDRQAFILLFYIIIKG